MKSADAAPPSTRGWLLRFALAFGLLNTLLTFENRWSGFGVAYMPRLSFELCLAVVALMGWVAWRGRLSPRATTVSAVGFMALVLVRYASVTAPAVMGRPVNVYWDGRHASELLRVTAQSWPVWQGVVVLSALLLGTLLLTAVARWAIAELARCLAWERPRPWLLAGVGACTLSFAAYVPEQRDTRWFFSLPLTPTLVHQAQLLARVWLPGQATQLLGVSPAFDGDLSGLVSNQGVADVLLVFAESYGAITFDDTAQAAALAAPRTQLAEAIRAGGRFVVSSRVTAPTFGGASWLSHATLLTGVDITDPAHHDLLLTSQRPTLARHFARHGYRTVGWMPGLKSPWPEGAFYGFDRLADDAGIGYRGPDFGYWRIPDQAAMALLQAQELDRAVQRSPRFAVFATTSTHAPFHPIPPFVADWTRLTRPDAYTPAEMSTALAAPLSVTQPLPQYLESLRYQFAWLADYLRRVAPRPLVMVIVGDHQPPALVSGPGASWDVPVHVVSDDPALLQRLLRSGFVPGLNPPATSLGSMPALTSVLLNAFDVASALETLGVEHVARPELASALALLRHR
ncbi:sulfatase-like hydrolase/transferase [Hydrogenophaga sp.]|uniref:sulfatase-like hydrolase/transferase n=1 Tax=Hydrogenophaga sp. TaxID=1904254 RepID=UPI0025B7A7BF|nr:sulfatase-like hydrolase/transferase [Hydrogenophaga sp.]MBT9464647.1 sulfatase-like hydrolase/transferase [Hydrogenophaga sp.]